MLGDRRCLPSRERSTTSLRSSTRASAARLLLRSSSPSAADTSSSRACPTSRATHPPACRTPNVIATSYRHHYEGQGVQDDRPETPRAQLGHPVSPPHHAARVSNPNERAASTLACSIVDPEERADLLRHHADLTGRLPVPTRSGSLYVLITYSEYSNCIHLEFLRSRTARDIVDAHSRAHIFFLQRGERGTIMMLDNEISKELKEFARARALPSWWSPSLRTSTGPTMQSVTWPVRQEPNHLRTG